MAFVPSEKTIRAAFSYDIDSYDLARFRLLAKADKRDSALHKAESLIGGYGSCVIRHPERGLLALYVNTGDTYSTTLLFNVPSNSWRVTTWGDYVESLERRRGRNFTESLSCY